jgi:hypothetical protein
VFCVLAGSAATLAAQSGSMPPPKVLVVTREFVKPGKSGSLHVKTESAFVQANMAAKWPTRYLGTDALTGPLRSVFFIGYDSFEAWDKDMQATQANATLSAALDHAYIADGELLSAVETNVYVYREDMSLNANGGIADKRYFEVSRFKVKQGHEKDWDALVKIYQDGYSKIPNGHWATFEQQYGVNSGDAFVVITPMKSLAEIDTGFGDNKKFMAAIGDDGAKRLAELSAACIESVDSNVLQFNPKMSYPRDEWVKADPGFWKPKATTAPAAKKPEAKPAQ